MSGTPSLLIKGSLKKVGKQSQVELDEKVPMDYIVEWIRGRKDKVGIDNRILMLTSQTGSGKSTVMPVRLYEEFIKGSKNKLIDLQPTVITTIGIAKEIVDSGIYPMMQMGQNVGYSTGKNKLRAREGGITIATLGTLLMQMKVMTDEEFIAKYNFIIVDEAHKRTVDLEILILLIKALYVRNEKNINLPFLIFTSATFDAGEFIEYFNLDETLNHIYVMGPPTYKKTRYFLDKPKFSDYMKEAVSKAMEIHNANYGDEKEPKSADVLIFLPGYGEMALVKEMLEMELGKLVKNNLPLFVILDITQADIANQTYKYTVINSTVDEIEHNKLNVNNSNVKSKDIIGGVASNKKYIRKIILATEVAETGLTINTLKYVIETGYFKEMTYDAVYSVQGLLMKPVSQASATQRMGRVGRKSEGFIYALYSEEVYNNMIIDKFPEILTTDISGVILTIISVLIDNDSSNLEELPDKKFNPCKIDLLQKIPLEGLKAIVEKCITLGMISEKKSLKVLGGKEQSLSLKNEIKLKNEISLSDYNLTAIGKISNVLSLNIMHSKMILSGLAWRVSLLDLIAIAAYISVDSRDIKVKGRAGEVLPIKWAVIMRVSKLVPWLVSKESLIRERILMMSDFIRGIFIVEALLQIGKISGVVRMYKEMQRFCKKVNLNIVGVLSILEIRENIINALLGAGIDIYNNSKYRMCNIMPDEFANTIVKLKYCIYEGFKLNIATYDENNSKYRLQHGKLMVNIPAIFDVLELDDAEKNNMNITIKTCPKMILYDKIELSPNPNNDNIYKLKFNYIEACDGFINPDMGIFG